MIRQTRGSAASDGGIRVRGDRSALNPFAGSRPGSAAAIAAAVLLLAFAIGLLLIQATAYAPARAEYRLEQVEARAAVLAERLEAGADRMRATADAIATSPSVASALREPSGRARDELEAQLGALLPQVLRLRILPAGSARVAMDDDPPLTFAGIDQIRRAEAGGRPEPEALRVPGRPLPLINIARPAAGRDEAVPGTVFLTFDARMFAGMLGNVDPAAEAVVLEQATTGGEYLPVLEIGGGDTDWLVASVELGRPGWRLGYRTAPERLPQPPLTWGRLLPGLVLIVFGGLLGIAIGYRRLARVLGRDLNSLVATASALFEGREGHGRGSFTLEPLAITAEAIRDAARKSGYGTKHHDADRRSADTQEMPAGPPTGPAASATAEIAPPAPAASDDFLEITDEPEPQETTGMPSAEIFRAYDIRGVVGDTLTEDGAYLIGRAIGSEAADAGESRVVVGADGRHSSPALRARISAGIMASGVDVLDIGAVPTPVLYYATHVTDTRSGVMVTGSHNPPEYNGFKVVIAGDALAGERITALHTRIVEGNLREGEGGYEERDLIPDYIDRIAADIALAQPLKVVADCGNGIAGKVIPRLLEALGCDVVPLYCEVDGSFPNHHPDPADPANLTDLISTVQSAGADLGLAFDGDGDRLGVITERGEIIWPDRLLMLFCRDIVGRNPGADVIFDVKCSRHLNALIAEYGGRPIMWRTGHSHIKAKMKETRALLGGEFSGHICFGERWYGFDDGLYSAARLLEILAAEAATAGEIFDEFPNPVGTPELKITTSEAEKFAVIERLAGADAFAGGDINTIDGIRVDYPQGWGLIRASNTSPVLTLRFEADDEAALESIRERFRDALAQVAPDLTFPS